MVTAVVAVLLSRANGALSLVPWKVSPILCMFVPERMYADIGSGDQQMGDAVSAGPGAQMTMHCKSCICNCSVEAYLTNMLLDKYNDATKKYDQTVSLDGKVVSRLSSGKFSIASHSFQNTADTYRRLRRCSRLGNRC